MVQLGETSDQIGTTRRIYLSLLRQIEAGVFAVGMSLPSSRSLAEELGVSRTTVTAAFDQLISEGYVRASQGKRPTVASAGRPGQIKQDRDRHFADRPLSDYATRAMALRSNSSAGRPLLKFDFRYGDLASDDFPHAAWRKALTATFLTHRERQAYDDPAGNIALRKALHGYVWRSRGIICDLEQIIVVNGSQQALDLCARVLVNPDDKVVLEDPCYAMARNVLIAVGATAVAVPCDDQGMDTTLLPDADDVALAYVTPSHQFPLGGVLPVGRRQAVMGWARSSKAYVVEDDYDGEYRYDVSPIPPLYLLGEGRVIYVGTVSKTLSPALRLGYMVLPKALVGAFIHCKQFADRHTATFEQEALAFLLTTGAYERHVRRMRRANAKRREVLLTAMAEGFGDEVEIVGTSAGLHVVVWFNHLKAQDEEDLATRARASDIGIYPVSRLYSSAAEPRAGFVFGYASMPTPLITKAIKRLYSLFGLTKNE
ncbi:PLP-dependent aminotransferase family protein [Agrobacterium tumefaciens]|uniref:GntR family transcriptional regulator n=1 Tax=Agrobacterium tumefaciens TaxID=358 RepID=A0A2L2LM61_AGRTU|nr:PLP-dependent aminotransferase family protein [Agrobacterium tumefaciens]AVH45386.1 GntR family transcriptional regulator [Agrobacterium tumefaciens]NSY99115.1 PLP-dependent aminotransferase family protein [Agrobacterium tumefaciens]